MANFDEEKLSEFFVKAFREVVLPVLEQHGNQLTEIQETVDSHTDSLHHLEQVHGVLKDISADYQDTKVRLNGHEKRITQLEEGTLRG